MSAPSLSVQYNGLSQVSSDNLNTYVQWCTNIYYLRAFSGVGNMLVYLQGLTSVGDGGQGYFYWNSSGTAADDGGITTVAPSSVLVGVWTRLVPATQNTYSLQVPVSGFSITMANYVNALLLNPAGTLGSGTITLPALVLDGQEVKIASSQTISSLTVQRGTGQTVIGAPTTITNTTPVQFIYNLANKTFYRSA